VERDIERTACKRAEDQGWYQKKITSPGRRGTLDRIFHKGGVTVYIEVKQPGGALSPHQHQEMRLLDEHGIPNAVAYTTNEALTFLGKHDPEL